MLLLLTYGIFSPFASAAIGINVYCGVSLLKACICRYYTLQFSDADTTEDSFQSVTEEHSKSSASLEFICENAHDTIHHMFWPGLVLSTIIFSIYLFEMSLDGSENLAASIVILVLTNGVSLLAILTFRHKQMETLRLQQCTEMPIIRRHDSEASSFSNSMSENQSGGGGATNDANGVDDIREERKASFSNPMWQKQDHVNNSDKDNGGDGD